MSFGVPSFGDAFGVLSSGIGDVFDNAIEETSDYFTGADSDAVRANDEAAEHGERTRRMLDAIAAPAIAGLGQGAAILPNVVVPENFEAMSHEEIYGHAITMTPDAITLSAKIWRGAEEGFAPLVESLWDAINPILDTEWRGTTSSAARAAVQSYADATQHLLSAIDLIIVKLDESSSGLEQTRAQVPPPHANTPSDWFRIGGTAVTSPSSLLGEFSRSHAEAVEEHQRAVTVMSTVYTPVIVSSDTGVPELPPPLDPTNPGVAPASTAGSSTAGGGGYSSPSFGTGSNTTALPFADSGAPSTEPGFATREPAHTAPAADSTNPTASTPAASSATPTSPTTSASGNSSPTSTQPASWVAPAGSAPGSTRFGSGSGAGSASSAGGLRKLGGPNGEAPVQRGGGAPTAGSPVGLSSNSMRSTPYGAGGMMPGARANGDQDGEHTTPGYLVTIDNGDELVGRLPLVAPPVID